MEVLKALILGIIQGITEFLPISSSGHLSLFRYFFNVEADTAGLFSAMLHIGTLVAILLMFYKPVYELFEEFFLCIKDIFSGKFTFNLKKMSATRRMLFMFVISCIPLLFLLIPTGKDTVLMDSVDVFSSDDSLLAEGICFMVTGFLLVLGTTLNSNYKKMKNVSPASALAIGVAQFFAACFPGISRSGSTISTALACGVSKKNAVRYSFILSIPAVLASGLVEFKDAMEADVIIPVLPLVVGVVASAVVGVFAIKILQIILKKDLFKYFGFYCLALGFIVTIVSAIGKI
ncbi:MAG: undecaprenyl-diphosphate phosphatase [Acutalibacteraceae bacterium]